MLLEIKTFFAKKHPIQSSGEEFLNSISHTLAAIASFMGLILLVTLATKNGNVSVVLATITYGVSTCILFTLSSIYHYVQKPAIKEKLRIADHCSIFIMIAGTYTPVLVIKVDGIHILILQWSLVLLGVIFKIYFTGRFELISLIIYLTMGWLALFIIDDLYLTMASTEFWLMIMGGLAYTLGIIFYVFDHRIKYGHFIWHLFVLQGSVFHFIMIASCLV